MKTHLPVRDQRNYNATYCRDNRWRKSLMSLALMVGFLFGTNIVNAQCDVMPQFTIDQTDQLMVHFADSSTHAFTSWQWNFGDGQTSNMQHPDHQYTGAGVYDVTLTASDGTCSSTRDMKINVTGTACASNFDGSDDPNNNLHVFGYDKSFSLNNNITSWMWTMGNGDTVYGNNVDYTYAAAGAYDICLTIQTSDQCTNSFCQSVNVGSSGGGCNANFYSNQDQGDYKSFTFQDQSSPQGGIASWSWNFGDGQTSTVQNPAHTFTADGDYNVCLTITDTAGCSSSWCNNLGVWGNSGSGCQANFGSNQDSADWSKVFFTNYSNSPGSVYTWDFGDGSTSNEVDPNHIYATEGDYNVCLIMENTTDQCTDTICNMIGVYPFSGGGNNCNGDSHFTFSNDPATPLTYTFVDDSGIEDSLISNRTWNFGDGNSVSNQTSVTHNYASPGNYYACLVLEFVDGCTKDWCLNVAVSDGVCTANFGGNMDTTTQTPNTIQFDNYSSYGGASSYSYLWDFGDGTTSTEANPVHSFGNDNYNVCLTINVNGGAECTHTACQNVDMADTHCEAHYYFQQDTSNYHTFAFHDQSNGNQPVIEWSWDFGDGSNSAEQNPTHTFPQVGNYEVCLTTLTEDSCSNTKCMNIMVEEPNNTPPPPSGCFANFFIEHDTTDYTMVWFQSQSNSDGGNITSWEWNFGDNQTGSGQNVSHQFPAAGEYEVTLMISDDAGCSATHNMIVHIQPLDQQPDCFASFTFAHDTTNMGGVQFYASGSSNLTGGYWDFGDGSTDNTQNPYHTFPGEGFYNVCITVWDSVSGCQNQFCQGVQIGDPNNAAGGNNCFADFDFAVTDNTVIFEDQSQGNITGWYWHFGDGNSSNDQNPSFTYANGGYYNVCLDVVDSVSGCQAHYCEPVEIVDTNQVFCHANFYFMPSPNNPDEFMFSNTSDGNYTNVHWTFGDGSYSDEMNPSHVFTAGGFYEVCLTVFDSVSNCQATYCDQLNLGIDSNNVDNNCFPEFSHFVDASGAVMFNDESMGSFTNWHWEFGDGSFSDDQNPSHVYTNPGYYDVCLSVWDSLSGCQGHVCHPVGIQDTTGNNDGAMCNADFDYFIDAMGDVHFNNTSTGNLTSGFWNFGDGVVNSDNINPVHHFANPGVYEVCVTVFDSVSNCQDQYCEMIQIADTTQGGQDMNCFAEFTFFPTGNGYEMVFNNTSDGNFTNVHWEFGDGSFSDMDEPSHVFPGPGFYQVCLGIMDSTSGCMAHVCHDVQVGDMATDTMFNDCFAQFSYFSEPDGSVHFENLSQGGFTNVHWNFGDMTFSDMYSPSHMFPNSGDYNVCLMIMDSVSGCMAEYCDVVYVTGTQDSSYTSCEASFNFMPMEGSTVAFNNMSVGSYTDVHWEFGNFGVSDDMNPTFTFPGPGVYEVCMGVMDSISGCMDHVCQPVHVSGGIVDSTMVPMDCFSQFDYFNEPDGSVVFMDQSQGSVTNWHWSFGDGTFSDMQNPAHMFAPGNYMVCLMIMDSTSGCMAEYCEEIYVVDMNDSTTVNCNADFHVFPEADGTVVFENVSQGTYTEVFWQFSDGTTSSDYSPVHQFTGIGDQGACLTILDAVSGCQDMHCDGIFIAPDTSSNDVYCEADFNLFPVSDTEVEFVNTSYGTYTNVFWQFSDGTQSYNNNPVNDFGTPGMHGACLTVIDTVSGCQATACEEIELFNDTTVYCNAEFIYFPVGNDVSFEPMATGSYTGLSWDFGDGFNSNDEFPTHNFDNGYYDVCLTVFDSISGCMNTYCEEINVLADQVANENCSSEFTYYIEQDTTIVHFTDASTGGASSWYWSFGDNSPASMEQNPVYTYAEDGYYEVCLTVFTDNGCQETYCQVIAVGDVSNSCFAKFNYYADAVSATAHYDNVALGNLDTYQWSFGDGMESFQYEPSHTFADTGYYASCLVVSSSVTGCEDIYCEDIRVGNAVANPCLFSCVWPGDANNDLEANHYDLLVVGLNYGETGPARDSVSTAWIGHYGQDWSTAQWDGVNNKNGDCNGDGEISDVDIEAIEQNFAFSHPDQPRSTGEELTFEILTPNVTIGEDIEIAVIAGSAAPVSMYGIGFEFSLDPTLFDFTTLSVDYSNSWLGDTMTDMIAVDVAEEAMGQLFIAMSRKDHVEQVGQGEICRLTIRAIGIDEDGTDVGLTTNGGMDAQGDTIPFTATQTDNVVINSIEDQEFVQKSIVVYPNPTEGDLNFNLPIANGVFEIRVYDQIGNLVYQGTREKGGSVNLDLVDLANGVYTLEVVHDQVQYIQRFNMNR